MFIFLVMLIVFVIIIEIKFCGIEIMIILFIGIDWRIVNVILFVFGGIFIIK